MQRAIGSESVVEVKLLDTSRVCCRRVVESLVNELGDWYVDNWLSPLLDVFFPVIPAKTPEALILPLFFVFCLCYPIAGLFFFEDQI